MSARAAALLLAAALAAAPARAETVLALDVSRDAEHAGAVQLGMAVAGERFGWHMELAHSSADGGELGQLGADDIAFGASFTTGAWTWSADADLWRGTDGVETSSWTLGMARRGERWDLGLEYTSGKVQTLLPDTTSADLERRDYTRSGYRLRLERGGERWRAWAEGSRWSYDPALDAGSDALLLELQGLVDLQTMFLLISTGNAGLVDSYLSANGLTELQQVLAVQGLPGLTRVIRYQQRRVAYALALHTFALGLTDPQARLGVERRFGANAVSLEYELLEIPVDGLQAESLALAWRMPMSDAADLTLTLGAMDTEGYGSIGFAGLTFELYFD